MIYCFMFIAAGSPDIWLAISLIVVGLINIILSIKCILK